MLLDWLIYGVLTWGIAALLNVTVFTQKPASKAVAWTLTLGALLVNLVAMTALQHLRYQVISHDFGIEIKPKSPLDVVGAFTFSWLFYSLLRKRPKSDVVKSTLPLPATLATLSNEPTPVAIQAPPEPNSAATVETAGVPQEQFWSDALAEFEGASRRLGLWARAFSEAHGNESLAKARYLHYRAAEFEQDHLARIAGLEQLARVQTAQAELLRNSEAERAKALLPKGTCPHCRTVIHLSSESCPKCGAMFGSYSSWRPIPIPIATSET